MSLTFKTLKIRNLPFWKGRDRHTYEALEELLAEVTVHEFDQQEGEQELEISL